MGGVVHLHVAQVDAPKLEQPFHGTGVVQVYDGPEINELYLDVNRVGRWHVLTPAGLRALAHPPTPQTQRACPHLLAGVPDLT